MARSHRALVEALLADAAAAHRDLLTSLPPEIGDSLPVDAQGITRAIDHIGVTAGLSAAARAQLIRPHAVNPAVLHARVFGGAPLAAETVIGAFVDGARVRADALVTLASCIDDEQLVAQVQAVLIDHPLPLPDGDNGGSDPFEALRAAYAAQEHAAVLLATRLDAINAD